MGIFNGIKRDPKRIPEVLNLIKMFWELPENTDLRLGQLIIFLNNGEDPFNLEDDDLVKKLNQLAKILEL